jgi:sugar (pentulose or hexulose) kinase
VSAIIHMQGPDVPIVLVGGGAERSKVAQALSSLTSRPIKVVQGNVQEAVAAGTAYPNISRPIHTSVVCSSGC